MRLLVSGSRRFAAFPSASWSKTHEQRIRALETYRAEKKRVFEMLDSVRAISSEVTEVYSGGANGVDLAARSWAQERGLSFEEFPVQDQDWLAQGRVAGIQRNLLMLSRLAPQDEVVVIRFPASPGSQHMEAAARSAGYRVHLFLLEE